MGKCKLKHSGLGFHTYHNNFYIKKIMSVDENVETMVSLFIAMKTWLVQLFGKCYGGSSQKLEKKLLYGITIPLGGTFLKAWNQLCLRDFWTVMIISHLHLITK